jgi:hypothetical protein
MVSYHDVLGYRKNLPISQRENYETDDSGTLEYYKGYPEVYQILISRGVDETTIAALDQAHDKDLPFKLSRNLVERLRANIGK